MKRILLDENVPIGLVALLAPHDVRHLRELGWTGISDRELISRTTSAGFDALLTADQNLQFQQNLRDTSIAIVVLGTTPWASTAKDCTLIEAVVREARLGSTTTVLKYSRGRLRERDPS